MNKNVISIPAFGFENDLTGLIVELERVREKFDHGTTSPSLFFELKNIFQLSISMTSARIEGNHTTVVDVVDAINDNQDKGSEVPDDVREIVNIQEGINFIESTITDSTININKEYICQVHKIVVKDLVREGDERPGGFRTKPVIINKSLHKPPQPSDVDECMQELVEFINKEHGPQFDLLKDAIVHHRFTWIHPFTNGNGRVARLLTYAMMAKQGFIDASGIRALNPTAVFGSNREGYYNYLGKADSLKDGDILAWAEYMLKGVKNDLDKVANLQHAEYVRDQIIIPALKVSLERRRITQLEYDMLRVAARKDYVEAKDFYSILPSNNVTRSRAIKRLRIARLLKDFPGNSRRYRIGLAGNVLTSSIMQQLDSNGFLPILLKD